MIKKMNETWFYPAHKYESHSWISVDDICHDDKGNIICFETEDEAIDFLKKKYCFSVGNQLAVPYGEEIAVYAISKVY